MPLYKAEAEPLIEATPDLACTWSFVKGVVSVLQFLYAVSSLYRTKGDQINTYGYAAFGLTVAPYAVMSFVNLLGNLVAVESPKIYLVDSPIMQEAIERGGKFTGVVGKLRPAEAPESNAKFVHGSLGPGRQGGVAFTPNEDYRHHAETKQQDPGIEPQPGTLAVPTCVPFERAKRSYLKKPGKGRSTCISSILKFADWRLISKTGFKDLKHENQAIRLLFQPWLSPMDRAFLIIMLYLPAVASIGGLSGFHARKSTKAERVWTMMWLVLGFYMNSAGSRSTSNFLVMRCGDSKAIKLIVRKMINSGVATEEKIARLDVSERFNELYSAVLYSAPAIGGFVVVGQMLNSYGECFGIF